MIKPHKSNKNKKGKKSGVTKTTPEISTSEDKFINEMAFALASIARNLTK